MLGPCKIRRHCRLFYLELIDKRAKSCDDVAEMLRLSAYSHVVRRAQPKMATELDRWSLHANSTIASSLASLFRKRSRHSIALC